MWSSWRTLTLSKPKLMRVSYLTRVLLLLKVFCEMRWDEMMSVSVTVNVFFENRSSVMTRRSEPTKEFQIQPDGSCGQGQSFGLRCLCNKTDGEQLRCSTETLPLLHRGGKECFCRTSWDNRQKNCRLVAQAGHQRHWWQAGSGGYLVRRTQQLLASLSPVAYSHSL